MQRLTEMKLQSMRTQIAVTALLAGTYASMAGTDIWFTPLTQSAPVVPPNDLGELSSPWVTPEGIHQKNALSLWKTRC